MSKLPRGTENPLQGARVAGAVIVAVAIDGRLAGEIRLADELRSGTQSFLQRLRMLGVQRVVLATGDRSEVADAITAGLGIDAVRSGLTPDQKVMVVLSERKNGPVMMVGDGVNDAPALAAADVGVAMGARGTAASAEAADVVILVDHLDRIVPAMEIARRSRFIALEGVFAGMGLSLIGMVAAALGYLTPVEGALIQEAIDVAVIMNALRALRGGKLS
jgi:P-type E1-E2 ATPase